MTINFTHPKTTVALLLTLGLSAALAQAQPKNGKRPQGPPPEAFAACEAAQEGDACTFNGRGSDELEGTCKAPPKGEGKLACVPEGGHPPKSGQES